MHHPFTVVKVAGSSRRGESIRGWRRRWGWGIWHIFMHKRTLSLTAGGSNRSRGLSTLAGLSPFAPPQFNHCPFTVHPVFGINFLLHSRDSASLILIYCRHILLIPSIYAYLDHHHFRSPYITRSFVLFLLSQGSKSQKKPPFSQILPTISPSHRPPCLRYYRVAAWLAILLVFNSQFTVYTLNSSSID